MVEKRNVPFTNTPGNSKLPISRPDLENAAILGKKIHKRRKELNLYLRDLASLTGLTVSFLSQVERGQSSASIESIRKICGALSIPLFALFSDEAITIPAKGNAKNNPYSPLVRADGRAKINFPDIQVTYELLTPSLSWNIEAFYSRLEPGKGNIVRRLREPTEEIIYLISGALTVELEDKTFIMHPNDTLYFEGMKLKKLANNSDKDAVWLNFITPPVF